mmetsp:Transcript_83515/g.190494  ORF Transcript_83515/g.190494 Transcript_83515/m.190494 type:complete len:192 (+) Transcript_83515:1579-2154(+)
MKLGRLRMRRQLLPRPRRLVARTNGVFPRRALWSEPPWMTQPWRWCCVLFLHEMQARHQLKLAEWGQSNEVLAFMGVRPPRPSFLSDFRSAMRGLLPIARKVSKYMAANPSVKLWRLIMRQAGVPEMRTLFRSKRHTASKKSIQRAGSTLARAPVSIPLSGRNASGLAVRADRPPALSGSIFSLSPRVPDA